MNIVLTCETKILWIVAQMYVLKNSGNVQFMWNDIIPFQEKITIKTATKISILLGIQTLAHDMIKNCVFFYW